MSQDSLHVFVLWFLLQAGLRFLLDEIHQARWQRQAGKEIEGLALQRLGVVLTKSWLARISLVSIEWCPSVDVTIHQISASSAVQDRRQDVDVVWLTVLLAEVQAGLQHALGEVLLDDRFHLSPFGLINSDHLFHEASRRIEFLWKRYFFATDAGDVSQVNQDIGNDGAHT